MSDTLQEREDQTSDDGSREWCDDCHGYTHMPYCPSYESGKEVSGGDKCAFVHRLVSGSIRCGALRQHHSQYTGHRFTEPESVNQHEPAAWGGGDEWMARTDYKGCWEIIAKDADGTIRTIVNRLGFYEPEEQNARQIVTEHNQHQSLVAERERLRAAIEVAIHNLNAGNDPKFLADYLQLTLNQQRSTSE